MRCYLSILLFLLLLAPAKAQPKYEVRAAWVTAVYGLDWPRTKATTPTAIRRQQEELTDILDKLKAANFNTILFQTRTRGDVLYHSSIEPYNSILTGKVDGDPGYDPLAFAVRECHKRGMECHAWMVAILWGTKSTWPAWEINPLLNKERSSTSPIRMNIFSIRGTRLPKNT